MQFDAMLGKSPVGEERKVPEMTEQEAKNYISCLEGSKHRKPYEIPGASLMQLSKMPKLDNRQSNDNTN